MSPWHTPRDEWPTRIDLAAEGPDLSPLVPVTAQDRRAAVDALVAVQEKARRSA